MRDREYIDQFLSDMKQDEELLVGKNMCDIIYFNTKKNEYKFMKLSDNIRGHKADQVILSSNAIPTEEEYHNLVRRILTISYVPDEFQIQIYG